MSKGNENYKTVTKANELLYRSQGSVTVIIQHCST